MERPLFPRYYNIRDVKLLKSAPLEFTFRIGNSVPFVRDLTVTGDVLACLVLSDGNHTTEEIFTELLGLNPSLQREQFDKILASLASERLLVDASAESAAQLSSNDHDRYSRHLTFYSMFSGTPLAVQHRLQRSTVAILGLGGIGTWVSYLLSVAGVGTLHLVDGDTIELSNITRQVLYTAFDTGKSKVTVARERILAHNPGVEVVAHDNMIDSPATLAAVLEPCKPDLVILSADRPEGIADWLDQWTIQNRVPWSIAGYTDATGRCGPLFVPAVTGCRACHVVDPEPHDRFAAYPLIGEINERYQVPSFGPLNGMIASMQAKEAICWLGGLRNEVASFGTLLSLEAGRLDLTRDEWTRNPLCPRCSHLFSSKDKL